MEPITVSQVILMGVVLVLFLNAAVYALRAQYILVRNRTDPILSVVFQLALWRRTLSGDTEGLKQQDAELFLTLRRSFFISACLLLFTMVAGLRIINH